MSDPRYADVLRKISSDARPDADLLARFADGSDPDAFAELVSRHGPLVWGVCRRQLPTVQDAEDAWQAVFLALALKPTSIREPAATGCSYISKILRSH